MEFYKAGDKGRAVCESCKELVDTTFAYRDMPFSDGPGTVKGILVAVCDTCNVVVSIPAQSTPAIKAARELATKPVEVSLPAPFVEVLDLAAYRIDPQATAEFRKRLLAYYIHHYASSDGVQAKISSIMEKRMPPRFNLGGSVPKRRLSFKVTPRLDGEIRSIMESSKLRKTELIKHLILQIYKDIVQPKKPKYLAELRHLAAVAAG